LFLILLIYLVSAVSWGAILFQLTKVIISTHKNRDNRPPLLVPLAIASLALFLESVYFGVSAFFYFAGNNDLFYASLGESNWFLVKILIAVSGVMLMFSLHIGKK
jgi:hypothetical protein